MGEKNMFKKSKLFEREGFYIVLFVCLCIVAVTGVYMSKSNTKAPQQVVQNKTKTTPDSERSTTPVLTQSNEADKSLTLPTSKSMAKSTKDVLKEAQKSKTKAMHKTKVMHKTANNFKIIYPVKGEIVKKYDSEDLQFTKSLNIWETHEGIDISCELGTEVKAAAPGKICEVVTKVDNVSENSKDGYGASITIDHGDGYRTYYANLDLNSIKLEKGAMVKAGEVIGKVGDTSKREQIAVDGSHLHFQVLKKTGNNYITVNPQNYLK